MHILSGVNMMSKDLVLVNAEEDALVRVPLSSIAGWRPASPQHTLIMPDEKTILVTTDATPPSRAALGVLRVHSIDWDGGTADVRLRQLLPLEVVGTPSDMPTIAQTDPRQPIMPWTRPLYTQTHAPTLLPHSDFAYITHYTDDRIRGFKIKRDGTLDQRVLFSDRVLTRQTHGVNFNPSGTVGLGVGYDYDLSELRIYDANRHTGAVTVSHTIPMGMPSEYGAFVHHAAWLDDRYAYVGAMQAGPTSRTLPGDTVIGVSIWLVDTEEDRADCVIGAATYAGGHGIFRCPSDVAVAAGKLYVAEEDSWAPSPDMPTLYGRDGYVSVWDISEPRKPTFIKRLRPGYELPDDFRNAHTITAMADEDSVFVSSFVSNHLIRIDTATDDVAKVFSAADGLDMFHGEFAAGRHG